MCNVRGNGAGGGSMRHMLGRLMSGHWVGARCIRALYNIERFNYMDRTVFWLVNICFN